MDVEETHKSRDEGIFRDLPDLIETVVQPVIQRLPTETSTVAPSGSSTAIQSETTSGTDAHPTYKRVNPFEHPLSLTFLWKNLDEP
ncbi:hypothetical protein H5410_014860 [Solanum commersonii]|uniref:Uncharacterized protein n=1 Tax=Solanum commersonii TaxID=4109 RepID=A0A9J5ZSP4_SOLCO|nr:hypothetical protein H5410_014860 [Solanum commersonii]